MIVGQVDPGPRSSAVVKARGPITREEHDQPATDATQPLGGTARLRRCARFLLLFRLGAAIEGIQRSRRQGDLRSWRLRTCWRRLSPTIPRHPPEGATQKSARADPRRSCTERDKGERRKDGETDFPLAGERGQRALSPLKQTNEHTGRRRSRSQFATA